MNPGPDLTPLMLDDNPSYANNNNKQQIRFIQIKNTIKQYSPQRHHSTQ